MTKRTEHDELAWELLEAGNAFPGLQTLLFRAAARLDRYMKLNESLQRQLVDLAMRQNEHGDAE